MRGNEEVSIIPENTVDWILVELRDSEDNTKVIKRVAGFLLNNGSIVNKDGEQLSFNVAKTSYYVVIYHRNHLPIMSANPVDIPD